MRFGATSVVAKAEMRTTFRLIQYWLYSAVVVVLAVLTMLNFTVLHASYSGLSATVGSVGPRYLIAQVGFNLVVFLLAGITLLMFDVRNRDVRDGIADVLDARPFTNFELVVGKTLGVVVMAWLPVLAVGILYESFGLVTTLLELPFGDFIEPVSLLGFLYQAFVALLFWSGLVVCLAILLKYRALVAVISLGLIAGQFYMVFNVPMHVVQWLGLLPSFVIASDISPRFVSEGDGLRSLAHLFLAMALIVIAVAMHPRPDGGERRLRALMGCGLLLIGLTLLGLNSYRTYQSIDRGNTWLAAHQEHEQFPRADLESLTGSLVIEPGQHIEMALELSLTVQAAQPIVLTLNPGLTVRSLTRNGQSVEWDHQHGILKVAAEKDSAGEESSSVLLTLEVSGMPDETFGYLDSANSRLHRSFNESQISLLGLKPSLFESGYVAMTPGSYWLPATGPDTPGDDPRSRPHDYFQLDLEVTVPDEWLVAGPGRRESLPSDEDNRRYRFRPEAPVPHVGLLASVFERRAMTVRDVEFEILLTPAHIRNLALFADATEVLAQRLDAVLEDATGLGLGYPYDGFSLVEVPNRLRGYGGGWRMDTVQSMPGVMMLRESGFPTSRFEEQFSDSIEFEMIEGGAGAAKVEGLTRYFENDFNGGNLFMGFARNLLQYQTSATGDGAQAINFVLDEVVTRLLFGNSGYFSAHEFDNQINTILGQIITNASQGRLEEIASSLHQVTTHRPSVWDRAVGQSLAAMDLTVEPRNALNTVALKSEAISRAIVEGLGREQTAGLLKALVTTFRGQTFTYQEMVRVAADQNVELDTLLGDWLNDAALPGFLFSDVSVARLSDDDRGEPRYQTMLFIRNDESVPGLIRLRYSLATEGEPLWDSTSPIRIPENSSVEVGVVTTRPILQLWSQPYLALNRDDQRLMLPQVDSEQRVTADPFSGHRTSVWQPVDRGDIIVDDLDVGFVVVGESEELAPEGIDRDQGLPEYQLRYGNVQYWSRAVYSDSYGKYRRTHTLVHPGAGASKAQLTAQLPSSGRWQLSIHLGANTGGDPQLSGGALLRQYLGNYEISLTSDGQQIPIEFDGGKSSFGWNDLGDFELSAGTVVVEIANTTDSTVVIVDAIRWRPARQDLSGDP